MNLFKRIKIKRKIRVLKLQITELEKKRARSQSALVDAILTKKEPSDSDVDYFNKYTARIDHDRERIRELEKQLEEGKTK